MRRGPLLWLLLVGVLGVLVLTGCAKPVASGQVIDKRYEAARDWDTREPDYVYVPVMRSRMVCNTVNKQQRCSSQTYTDTERRLVGWHTEHHHEPEHWVLVLENDKGDRGEVRVAESTYRETSIGNHYGSDLD